MKDIWPRLEGYKEYVRQVDLDQIQYESDELKIATKIRPYLMQLFMD
jgi:hypothetical protein